MESVRLLTSNNTNTVPESTQKRLPDLYPRCQSPNYSSRNLSLCSRQYVTDQTTRLCNLRNLNEGVNDYLKAILDLFLLILRYFSNLR